MKRRSNCPIACSLDLLGDKWTLLVLRDIVVLNKSRFEEFLASPEKISTNILTDRLHKLEEAGLICKEPYSNHASRMAYSPTKKGRSVATILDEFVKWGRQNFKNTSTIPQ
jgi:DNA-binding HxlR family transcriptional regulator